MSVIVFSLGVWEIPHLNWLESRGTSVAGASL